MITFEQAQSLKSGDKIYQYTGWKDNKPTSSAEWEVYSVTPRRIYIVNRGACWGNKVTLTVSDFPLTYWSLEKP